MRHIKIEQFDRERERDEKRNKDMSLWNYMKVCLYMGTSEGMCS